MSPSAAWRNLAFATFSMALGFSASGVISAFAPTFRSQFQLSAQSTAFLIAVPVLLGSLARLPIGMLTDRFGGRVVFAGLFAFVAVAAALVPGATSYDRLLIYAFLLGIILMPMVQMWLLTATLESYLAGHHGVALPRQPRRAVHRYTLGFFHGCCAKIPATAARIPANLWRRTGTAFALRFGYGETSHEEHPAGNHRRRDRWLPRHGAAALTTRSRLVAGWVAVALSTAVSAFWAVWGSIESFHEGWYYRETWRNVALMLVQYLPWMFVPMTAGLLALWRWPAGLLAHGALAAGAFWLFGLRSVGSRLIAVPVIVIAVVYAYGRPRPIRWARTALVAVPLLVAIVSGAYPAWRVFTRPSIVDVSMRRIQGDGVDLIWAPAGPGWDDRGFSWFEATRRCAYLTADGTALATAPQGHWRLPTVDEVVRTQRWRGASAGGAWDAAAGRVTYRKMPDKEAPLWHPYSQIIYWWTASDAGSDRAYRIAYNGYVLAVRKRFGADYTGCRCVKSVSAL